MSTGQGLFWTVMVALMVCMITRVAVPRSTQAHADTTPQYLPGYQFIGQLNSTTWLYHDSIRGTTCWVYSYQHFTASTAISQGGISCLPDTQLKDGHFQ